MTTQLKRLNLSLQMIYSCTFLLFLTFTSSILDATPAEVEKEFRTIGVIAGKHVSGKSYAIAIIYDTVDKKSIQIQLGQPLPRYNQSSFVRVNSRNKVVIKIEGEEATLPIRLSFTDSLTSKVKPRRPIIPYNKKPVSIPDEDSMESYRGFDRLKAKATNDNDSEYLDTEEYIQKPFRTPSKINDYYSKGRSNLDHNNEHLDSQY